MVGVRQKLVLEIAHFSPDITIKDVIDIFRISHKKSKLALIELEKLEMYGYLEKVECKYRTFRITKKGEEFFGGI